MALQAQNQQEFAAWPQWCTYISDLDISDIDISVAMPCYAAFVGYAHTHSHPRSTILLHALYATPL